MKANIGLKFILLSSFLLAPMASAYVYQFNNHLDVPIRVQVQLATDTSIYSVGGLWTHDKYRNMIAPGADVDGTNNSNFIPADTSRELRFALEQSGDLKVGDKIGGFPSAQRGKYGFCWKRIFYSVPKKDYSAWGAAYNVNPVIEKSNSVDSMISATAQFVEQVGQIAGDAADIASKNQAQAAFEACKAKTPDSADCQSPQRGQQSTYTPLIHDIASATLVQSLSKMINYGDCGDRVWDIVYTKDENGNPKISFVQIEGR